MTFSACLVSAVIHHSWARILKRPFKTSNFSDGIPVNSTMTSLKRPCYSFNNAWRSHLGKSIDAGGATRILIFLDLEIVWQFRPVWNTNGFRWAVLRPVIARMRSFSPRNFVDSRMTSDNDVAPKQKSNVKLSLKSPNARRLSVWSPRWLSSVLLVVFVWSLGCSPLSSSKIDDDDDEEAVEDEGRHPDWRTTNVFSSLRAFLWLNSTIFVRRRGKTSDKRWIEQKYLFRIISLFVRARRVLGLMFEHFIFYLIQLISCIWQNKSEQHTRSHVGAAVAVGVTMVFVPE